MNIPEKKGYSKLVHALLFPVVFALSFIFIPKSFAVIGFPDILTQPEMCKDKAGEIKKIPDNPQKAIEYFLIFLCAGEKKKAENFLRSADEKFPNNFLIKYNLGNFYLMEGKYDFAIFYLNQAKVIKKEPFVYEAIGTAYLRYGDTESAEKIFDEAIEKWSEILWDSKDSADKKKTKKGKRKTKKKRAIKKQRGKPAETKAENDKTEQTNENNLENKRDYEDGPENERKKSLYNILLKRGFVKLLRGKLDDAEQSFRKYISFDEFSPYAYIGLAEALGRKGKVKLAKEVLDRAIAVSKNPKIYLYAGAFLHSQGYFNESIPYYKKAAEELSSPEKYLSYFMLSAVERDLGMYVSAREHLEILKKEFPEITTAQFPYSIKKRIELVAKFLRKGNIKGAEFELREILKMKPDSKFAKRFLVDVLILKALLFSKAQEKIKVLEEAREIAKDYLEENPTDDRMLFNFALVNFWLAEVGPRFARTGNLLHAISSLQSALKIKEHPDYVKLLGISYYLLKKYDFAIDEFIKLKRKWRKIGDSDEINLLLASSYLKLGETKKAEKILRRIKNRKDIAFKTLVYETLKKKKVSKKILSKVQEAIIRGEEISPDILKQPSQKKKKKKRKRWR